MAQDQPISIEQQAEMMGKYIILDNEIKIKELLVYTGYFRLSCYGKYLLSHSNVLKSMPNQDLLIETYKMDVKLRKLFFDYLKKAEIQFKSHLSNAASLKRGDASFYLKKENYTPSKSEKNKLKKFSNRHAFENKFFPQLIEQEKNLLKSSNRFPELKEYRTGGHRCNKNIPCWASFSYFDFGTITHIYSFLNNDLRKEVLSYGYSRNNYAKKETEQVDTWLDAIRNLRNICAHHRRLIGQTSSVVLPAFGEEMLLVTDTDLFSRIYALRKILNEKDAKKFKIELEKLIASSTFDIFLFGILPKDWAERYDKISKL